MNQKKTTKENKKKMKTTKTIYRGIIACIIICILCTLFNIASIIFMHTELKQKEDTITISETTFALSAEKIIEEPITLESEGLIEEEEKTNRYSELDITDEDIELLARIVYLEARGQSFSGQRAVAEVVLNRVLDSRFPDTVYDVLYAKGQFTPAKYISSTTPTETQYEVVECVLNETPITTENTIYFATTALTKNVFAKIGAHYFCEG
jgi:spore germination cell wall hydrolase CwlJ-like protein